MTSQRRFDLNGKYYQVRFIAAGMGSADYAIIQCGAGNHNEIRVRIFDDRNIDGWWRATEYEAPEILREYFRLERHEYLHFCALRGLDPDSAAPGWERLYTVKDPEAINNGCLW
jgi:hypothetical protein